MLERICRLPSGSLSTGEGGGRGRGSSDFQVQSYNILIAVHECFAIFFQKIFFMAEFAVCSVDFVEALGARQS